MVLMLISYLSVIAPNRAFKASFIWTILIMFVLLFEVSYFHDVSHQLFDYEKNLVLSRIAINAYSMVTIYIIFIHEKHILNAEILKFVVTHSSDYHVAKNIAFARYQHLDEQSECIICYSPFNKQQRPTPNLNVLLCGHMFDTQCINEWERVQWQINHYRTYPFVQCPICRYEYNAKYQSYTYAHHLDS